MECDHCGACCRTLILEIEHVDVVREPKLAPPTSQLLDGNGRIVFDSDWEKQYLLSRGGLGCPLHIDNRCSVHATRPNACVMFEAGSPACQRARYGSGKPPLGREFWPEDEHELDVLTGMDDFGK